MTSGRTAIGRRSLIAITALSLIGNLWRPDKQTRGRQNGGRLYVEARLGRGFLLNPLMVDELHVSARR